MHGAEIYILLVILGNVAFWLGGGFVGCIRALDPVDVPWVLLYLSTPIPGLATIGNVLYAVWRRTHNPTPAERRRMRP